MKCFIKKIQLHHTVLAGIIILYSFLSLWRLGYTFAPSSSWNCSKEENTVVLDMGEEIQLGSLVYYLGNYENRRFLMETGSGEPVIWRSRQEITMANVYRWGRASINTGARYLRLSALNKYAEIKEIIITDVHGTNIIPVNAEQYPMLFDEQKMYTGNISFQSGTIFDEPLFARTAYEYLHGIRSYEDTHPPLGKLLIAVGIAMFGMNPFGWRFAGTIAGIAILPAVYIFSCRIHKNPWVRICVTALIAADFMHFTHTRLGGVDAFLVLFITGMYYFMYRYCETVMEDSGNGWKYLGFSGICTGLAVSCKWSGMYAAAGIGLIWTVVMVLELKRKHITWRYFLKTCFLCTIFYIAVPAVIYLTSYIPYVGPDNQAGFIESFINNQLNMFRYHSNYEDLHEFGSKWYEWPLIVRPIPYFRRMQGKNILEAVILLGNPVLWWTGFAAFFACLYKVLDKRDFQTGFLVTAYLAPVLPWIFISRSSFLYHYFPSLIPLVLMLGLWAESRGSKGINVLVCCSVVSAVLFIMFYPVLSGYPVPQEYVGRWLEWLPVWNFII